MADILTITPRLIYKEDLSLTTSNSPTPTATTVMGVGAVSLTPISAVLYSAFTSYANDTAAGVGGVGVGYLYYNSSTNLLKVRMS